MYSYLKVISSGDFYVHLRAQVLVNPFTPILLLASEWCTVGLILYSKSQIKLEDLLGLVELELFVEEKI